MAKLFDAIDAKLEAFIAKQPVFFVATAPLSADGHVNVSPKGYDSLAVLDPHTVAYIDFGGSGVETMAHLGENGRITLMFCAFDGSARILRLYGHGRAVPSDDPAYAGLASRFEGWEKARSVIVVELDRIADSCGWAVPFMELTSERDQYRRYIDNIPAEGLAEKWRKNSHSIDGLPAYAGGRPMAAE